MKMTFAALDEMLVEARAALFACFDECDAAATVYFAAGKSAATVHLRLAYARAAGRMVETCAQIYRVLDREYGRRVHPLYVGRDPRSGRVYCRVQIEPVRVRAHSHAAAASRAGDEELRPASQERRTIADTAEPARSAVANRKAGKNNDKPLEKIDEQFPAPESEPKPRRPGAPAGNRNALKTGTRSAEIRALRARVRALRRPAKAAVALFNALQAATANPGHAALLAARAHARSVSLIQPSPVQENRPARPEPTPGVKAPGPPMPPVAPRRVGGKRPSPAGRRRIRSARLDASRRRLFCPHPAARAGLSYARPPPRPSHAASHR
jgi:hypothetical protein